MTASTFTPSTTGFTTGCQNSIVSVATATSAATGFDWFATAGMTTAIGALANAQNKAFAQSVVQQARSSLLPVVKAELFAAELNADGTLLTNFFDSAHNSLTSIASAVSDNAMDVTTKTALAAAYTAELAAITATVNRIKSLETKVFAVGDSIDNPSTGATSVTSVFNAVTTATTFGGQKTYIGGLLDPAVLGNGGTAIPALAASPGYANAGTLGTIFSTAHTAMSSSIVVANFEAEVETAAKQVFDLYCIMLGGYSSTANTGSVASSPPTGLYPGIDFQLSTVGQYQAATGAAVYNAPSASTVFWNADNAHTW